MINSPSSTICKSIVSTVFVMWTYSLLSLVLVTSQPYFFILDYYRYCSSFSALLCVIFKCLTTVEFIDHVNSVDIVKHDSTP
jgi:hypothetical protein